jgi:hypothetical protein
LSDYDRFREATFGRRGACNRLKSKEQIMADQLVQLSDTINVTSKSLMTLAYEHTEEPLYVGWQINGTTVVDPGFSAGTPPWGAPCPGAPSVTYRCPVDGYFHEISLTSSSGDPSECLLVQVLYRGPADQYKPAHLGPCMYVCLAGSGIEWPADKLKAWEACLAALWGKLTRYLELAHVNPGDPVEFLASLPGEVAIRLQAGVETLEHLDAAAQPQLAKAIKDDVLGILRARMPGAEQIHGRKRH